jgi:hypothetical protein
MLCTQTAGATAINAEVFAKGRTQLTAITQADWRLCWNVWPLTHTAILMLRASCLMSTKASEKK